MENHLRAEQNVEIMSDDRYFIYILYSESGDRYYKGMSQNPERRLDYHNTKERGYTSRYRPWKLVYQRDFIKNRCAGRRTKSERVAKSSDD